MIILDCQSIFCNEESTYPIELIEIFKQLSEHLNETFGPPFSIYFKVNFDEDELKRCVTQYLLDEGVSEFEQSMIELVPLHSLPNRKIILSGTKIPSTVKSELVKKLKLIFGLPLTVKLE